MKRKQIVSLFLTVVLFLSLIIPMQAASPGLSNFKKQTEHTGFSDVQSSAWYAETVKTVCEYGMMKGKDADTFSPLGNVSIAEAVALACRLRDIYNGGSGTFAQASPWWQVYVDYWHDYSGYFFVNENDSFWRSAATRETFSWLLAEAIPADAYTAINSISVGSISDVSEHADSIYRLFNAGVLNGTTGYFHPYSAISRAEAATIIARIIDPSLRVEFTVTPTPSSSTSSASNSGSAAGSTTNATTPPATSCNYIINTNTGKFHYTWCKSVRKMAEKNKWYYTGTRDSVVAMGYVPCKNCNP